MKAVPLKKLKNHKKVVPIRKVKKKSMGKKVEDWIKNPFQRKAGTSIPHPIREAIKGMYIQGYNYSDLAEFFGIDWKTARKIANDKEMQDYVLEVRKEWHGYLGPIMRAAVLRAIQGDGRLAYEMMKGSGVVAPETRNVNLSWQHKPGETEDEAMQRIGAAWMQGAVERHKYFDMEMPTDVDVPLLEMKKVKKEKE
jgi:hypothetical protein